jgi:hypothetical protein
MTDVNHADLVAQCHREQPPEKTVEGALAFTVRVLNRLPRSERAGLLRKPAGENITAFHGVMVSAGRICYPNGNLYKILTDIPATMAPVWNDDGAVEPERYFDVSVFLDAPSDGGGGTGDSGGPNHEPPLDPGHEIDLSDVLYAAISHLIDASEHLRSDVSLLGQKIDQLRSEGIRVRLR